jgi:hypothetical protein
LPLLCRRRPHRWPARCRPQKHAKVGGVRRMSPAEATG